MRRILGGLCVALCLALPVVWAGCASTSTRESTGEYVDDSAVTAKVKAQLGADKLTSLFQISVETYKGVVQLSGFVNSQAVADRAVAVAQGVGGVREVKNSLVVKPQ
jgi:osmotically-inducible protein OsmY